MTLLFARLISIISNPLFFSFPTWYLLIYKTSNDSFYALKWAVFSFFATAVIGLYVWYGVQRGFFSDFDVSKREQRKSLFIVAGFVVVLYSVSVFLFNGPRILIIALTGLFLGIFLDSVINRRIKASIHVATFAAFASGMSLLYGGAFDLLFFLIPVVAWSRVKTKRHTKQEAFVGGALGVAVTSLLFIFVRIIGI